MNNEELDEERRIAEGQQLGKACRSLAADRVELAALRSAIEDVRAMVEEHGATVCPLALVIYDRLASLPPAGGGE